MRTCSVALVAYSSSSSDDDDELPAPKKTRKLPPLSSSLVTPAPVDNPALHQGRIRTTPHIEGQYTAHVYVSLVMERASALNRVIQDVLHDANALVPSFNSCLAGELSNTPELHISLSRPTYLRAHQREILKKAVKDLSRRFAPFTASFATFAELTNDERSRTFLTMEIGAGHRELQALSDTLTPTLQAIRQKEFYTNPRFHASIAWALLNRHTTPAPSQKESGDVKITSSESVRTPSPGPLEPADSGFPTIPHLPHNLVSTLNDRHGAKLSSSKTGAFNVNKITLKIGKQVYTWSLSG